MHVRVLLFARPRELAGAGQVDLELPAAASAGDAFAELSLRVPGLEAMRGVTRCAVDGEYTGWDHVLSEGAELALIPPTSGG